MTLSTTVDGLLERVRRDRLLGTYGPHYSIASGISDSDTDVSTNESIEHITLGSLLAVDYEIMRVTEVHHGVNMLSVARGAFGTTAAAHATGALIEQDAAVPKASLLDWAELEIRSWSKVLFRVLTLPLPVTQSERTYDLVGVDPLGIDFLLDVRAAPLGTATQTWPERLTWSADTWPIVDARLVRDLPVAEIPTGVGLQLLNFPNHAGDLRVAYASPFDLAPFVGTTDLISDVGLNASHLDVLEAGLRHRALVGSLQSRTDWRAIGINRDSQVVSVLDVMRAADQARSHRDRRLAEEAVNIRARYPYKAR